MQSMTLSSTWRKLLLTLHVTATVSVLGADLVLLALGLSSLGGADPRTIYPAAQLVSAWLVAPLAVLSLGTGLLLSILTPWGLLRYWWVAIKLAITGVLKQCSLVCACTATRCCSRYCGRTGDRPIDCRRAPAVSRRPGHRQHTPSA
jgi:hypothetical protein